MPGPFRDSEPPSNSATELMDLEIRRHQPSGRLLCAKARRRALAQTRASASAAQGRAVRRPVSPLRNGIGGMNRHPKFLFLPCWRLHA